MSEYNRKLALEIETMAEKALETNEKVRQSINQMSDAAEQSADIDKKIAASGEQAATSLKDVAFQAGMGAVAAQAFTGSFQEVLDKLAQGNERAADLVGSFGRVAGAMFAMGPAAGAIAAGMESVRYIIGAVIEEIDRINRMRMYDQIIADTYEWAQGLEEVLRVQEEIAVSLSENRRRLAELREDEAKINEELETGKKLKGAMLDYDTQRRLLAKEQQRVQEEIAKQEEASLKAVEDYNQMMQSVLDNGIMMGENVQNLADGQKYINELMEAGLITTGRKIELEQQLLEQIDRRAEKMTEVAALERGVELELKKTEETEKRITAGIDKRAEAERKLADEVLQLTTDVYTYRLAKLQEEYTEHAKVVRDKELLERWFTEKELEIYAERYDAEQATMQASMDALDEMINEKLVKQDELNMALKRMTMDETDFFMLQLDAQAEAYKESGADILDVELWKLSQLAQFQEKAAQETINRAQQTANRLVADARAAFTGMGQALQETLAWQTSMEEQYGAQSENIAEIRKKALQAAMWAQVKESIKAMAWEQVTIAGAMAIAGLWVQAGQHAAAAAALGAGAAMAGQFSAVRATEAQSMQNAFERQQQARQAELDAQREAENRAAAPEAAGGGSRDTGAKITNSTINLKYETQVYITGPIYGFGNVEKQFEKIFRNMAERGKLSNIRGLTK